MSLSAGGIKQAPAYKKKELEYNQVSEYMRKPFLRL
jgi:hypothetical protein